MSNVIHLHPRPARPAPSIKPELRVYEWGTWAAMVIGAALIVAANL